MSNIKFHGEYCAVVSHLDHTARSHTMMCHGDDLLRKTHASEPLLQRIKAVLNEHPKLTSMCRLDLGDSSKFIGVHFSLSHQIRASEQYVNIGYSFDGGEKIFDDWEFTKGPESLGNGAATFDKSSVSQFLERSSKAKIDLSYMVYYRYERLPIDYGMSSAITDFLTRCSDVF